MSFTSKSFCKYDPKHKILYFNLTFTFSRGANKEDFMILDYSNSRYSIYEKVTQLSILKMDDNHHYTCCLRVDNQNKMYLGLTENAQAMPAGTYTLCASFMLL